MVFFSVIALLSLIAFILTYVLAYKQQKAFGWIPFIIGLIFCILALLSLYYSKKWTKQFNKDFSVENYLKSLEELEDTFTFVFKQINDQQIKLQNTYKLGLLDDKYKPLSILSNHQIVLKNSGETFYGNWANFLDYDSSKQINKNAFFYQYLFGFEKNNVFDFQIWKKGYKTDMIGLKEFIKKEYNDYYLFCQNEADFKILIDLVNWEMIDEFFSIYDAKIIFTKNHFYIVFLTNKNTFNFAWSRNANLSANLNHFKEQQELTILLINRLIDFKNIWKDN